MPEGRSNEPGTKERKRSLILVVEDDSRTLRLERFILEEEGFEIAEAGTGEDALLALEAGGPALVLLDIGLPGIDGFTTCQRIREFSQVPIIMVTAEDKDEDKVRGLEIGADDYVTKPFSTTELAARVKAVLRRYDLTPFPGGASPPGGPQARPGEAKPAPPSGAGGVPGGTSTQQAADLEVYEGTVRLVVETTGCIRRMIHFVDALRQNSQFHLLRLVANQRREGMDIVLRLREPILLKPTLLEMKDVSRVDEPAEPSPEADERLLHVALVG